MAVLSWYVTVNLYLASINPVPYISNLLTYLLSLSLTNSIGGVICLVNSVNERDLSLLNNSVNDLSLAAVS